MTETSAAAAGADDSVRPADDAPRAFVGEDLSGATFRACDLSRTVMRAVDIDGAEIDAPWLLESGEGSLVVNGVDVAPYVEAELNRRFAGRELRRAETPADLHAAFAALEQAWAAAVERARSMPEGSLDRSVAGEWSFAQTVRHLIMATDMWFGRAIEQRDDPFHPLGQPDGSFEADGEDSSVFAGSTPPFDEVMAVRAERQGQVRDFIAAATPEVLAQSRPNPHAPEYPETVLSCLRTIIEEEWEHLRFATRDLDSIASEDA